MRWRRRLGLAALLVAALAVAIPVDGQVVIDPVTYGYCNPTSPACDPGGGAFTQFSFSHTVAAGSNRALAVAAFAGCNTGDDAPHSNDVEYDGVDLTLLEADLGSGGGVRAYKGALWALPPGTQPTVGSHTVTVKYGNSLATACAASVNPRFSAFAISAHGVDQSTTFTDTAIADGISTTPALTMTSSGANDAGFHAACTGQAFASTTEFAVAGANDSDTRCNSAGAAIAAATDINFSWTVTSDAWVMTGAVFKAAGAGGGASPKSTLLGIAP